VLDGVAIKQPGGDAALEGIATRLRELARSSEVHNEPTGGVSDADVTASTQANEQDFKRETAPAAQDIDDQNSQADKAARELKDAAEKQPSLLQQLFGDTSGPFFKERVVILAAHLAGANQPEAATVLVDAVLLEDASFAPAVALRDALTQDKSKAAEEQPLLIERAAELARRPIIQYIENARRKERIRAVLDQRLWPLAAAQGLPDTVTAGDLDLKHHPDITLIGSAVRVTVLVDSVDAATLDALKAVNFVVEDSSSATKLVVGLAPLGKLDDLALLPGVRRIELTQMHD
jgi:hypothetical protein